MHIHALSCLVILSVGTLTSEAQERIVFRDLKEMRTARSLISSASDGKTLYACNGMTVDVGFSSDVVCFNFEQNKWKLRPSILAPKRWSCAELIDGKLYVFNGINQEGMNKAMEVVNLETWKKTYSTENPQPARSSGSSVWDGIIYTVGGTTGSRIYTDRLISYNPETEAWKELEPIPVARETQSEIIDGKLYVLGGFNGKASSRVDVYDIATGKWQRLRDLPVEISAHATTVAGNRIWIIGDYKRQDLVAYYDVETEAYIEFGSNLDPRRHAGAEIVGNTLYAFGGNTNGFSDSSVPSIQAADISSYRK